MFKNLYYKIMALSSYAIGDLACNINSEWAGWLYQKCMLFSYDCDEKIGYQIWKVPPLNRKEDL
jgi:hypothetical protein